MSYQSAHSNAANTNQPNPTRASALDLIAQVRARTERLAAPLSPEDMALQSMEDASPAKWHLAHTSWFFETFVLCEHVPGYRVFDARYSQIFNSYYVSVSDRHVRGARSLLSRPSAAEVYQYRAHVTAAVLQAYDALPRAAQDLVTLGLHHECQHQELLLTDVLHGLAQNPLNPAYCDTLPTSFRPSSRADAARGWTHHGGGLVEIGHAQNQHAAGSFAFDNEGPRHKVFLEPFGLSERLVTNADWADFMDDGGYENALLWLSDGWAARTAEGWSAPLYWRHVDGQWHSFSHYGLHAVDPAAPVSHISFYEADAFARWAGARLPSEAEWEHAACMQKNQLDIESAPDTGEKSAEAAAITGHFLEHDQLTPTDTGSLYGGVWVWTQSAYAPYPGFRVPAGAVGEYNGKFMANQMVLRGGSCLTPAMQMRLSYRNFFYPHQRWQMTGLRLAKDV